MSLTAFASLAAPAIADGQFSYSSGVTVRPEMALPAGRMENMMREFRVAPPAGRARTGVPSTINEGLRERMEAGRIAGTLRDGAARIGVERNWSGGFDNPLADSQAPDVADQRQRAIGEAWDRLRGTERTPSGLDMIGRLGLPSNDTSRAEAPGLRTDTSRLDPGNIAGQRVGHPSSFIDMVPDDEPYTTKVKEGDEWVMTQREQDGSVRRTHEHHSENGDFVSRTYHYDEDGNLSHYTWNIQTARGASQTGVTDIRAGTQWWTTWGADGRVADSHDGAIRRVPAGGFDRTLSGEETSGARWCPPSGYGCDTPLTADELREGSRRERPAEDAGETRATVRVPLARDALVINPDPHREGGGGAPSARDFDGGRLVNPVGQF